MPTVLVVDDSAVDRKLVKGLLTKQTDLEVALAATAEEALEILKDLRPELIVTDLVMPGMSGLELVAQVAERYPAVPVILMTAHGSEEIAVRALEVAGEHAGGQPVGCVVGAAHRLRLVGLGLAFGLVRLASRTQTLRWYTDQDTAERQDMARESLEIYAPLANRLGVWQMKWEIEDLSFRFLEPATYKRIAKMLDERRLERESFIDGAVARLKRELETSGVRGAEVYGRPKHIYSIWNKMRAKDLEFAEVYDVRALRIVVDEIKDCYTALGLVHAVWQPIHGEFDDYISHPKGNFYRSLHTAVMAEDGRSLEVQIRTREMHRHAELGVAAHWRYKESGTSARADSAYDDKIALLRQLLSWRDEIADSAAWVEQVKRASLDDTIYVLTPQGRVIDMPRGATPVDFAYRLHTDLGHRCRGAKVDGHLVPLDTPLANGQRVEIVLEEFAAVDPDAAQRATRQIRLERGKLVENGRPTIPRALRTA